jgi:glucose-6-phosphate 1-dehydrogenase
MQHAVTLEPTILVIFGGGGDLAWRKLIPALYNLHLDKLLPERFAIVGVARRKVDDEAFRRRLREGVDLFSRRRPAEEASWNQFSAHVSYLSDDFSDPASGPALSQRPRRTCSASVSAVTAGRTASWWRSRLAGTWRLPWRWTGS